MSTSVMTVEKKHASGRLSKQRKFMGNLSVEQVVCQRLFLRKNEEKKIDAQKKKVGKYLFG